MKRIMSLSREWTILSETMYGEDFIAELAAFLWQNGVQRILECGCGNGHILEGLARKGFQGLGIDADSEMIALAQRQHSHPRLRYLQMNWLGLDQLDETFDAVLCRGNSLAYVVSWDKPETEVLNVDILLGKIQQSIRLMFSKVKPGGLLYLDTISQKEIDKQGGKVEFHTPNIALQGEIIHDWGQRLRITKGGGIIAGEKFHCEVSSYLMKPEELEEIVRGFRPAKVWSPNIHGEQNYHIVCARK